jgi:hypothetical protein
MPYDRGPQLFDPALITGGGGMSAATGIVARAGGLRPNATPLTACINNITVCVTGGDSVALPPAVGGQEMVLLNNGAAAAQVYAAVGTSDTINGTAAAGGILFAAGAKAVFVSPAPGMWFSILSA